MNAVVDRPASPTQLEHLLRPSYRALPAAALLEHFHRRTGVEYFPVIEPEQTRRERIDALLDNAFSFNGETHTLGEPIAWLDNPSADVEWHILLHKFYYSVGLGARWHKTRDQRYVQKWVALTDSWIASTPPGFIAADVTGRRIQNWIYAHYFFVTRNRPTGIPAAFYERFLVSLHEQTEYLRRNLHAARNHRTLELYAVFLAGVVFPEFAAAAEWREFALQEIARNVATDLLEDGVQCELSTDYHHIVLRNWLCVKRLAMLNAIELPAGMDAGLVRALEFSMHAHKPDGEVPAFSDGDVRSYRDLLREGFDLYGRKDMLYVATQGAQGEAPAAAAGAFTASGYYTMRGGWGRERPFRDEPYLMADCGPLGAGNHGHFDCLSFELAAFGRSLIVDPGRYTYSESGTVNWRALFRGTGSHNTVLVDGRNQTRYEPGPTRFKVRGAAPEVSVLAWHDAPAFTHLHARACSSEYPVRHDRIIHFVRAQYWIISDFLTGTGEHDFDLQFHLDPLAQESTRIEHVGSTITVTAPNLLIAQSATPEVTVSIDNGYVSRSYGEKQAAPVVRFRRSAARTSFHTVIYPFARQAPRIAVHELPVWCDDADDSDSAPRAIDAQALAIHIGSGADSVVDHWLIAPEPTDGALRFGALACDGGFAWARKDAFGDIVRIHAAPHGAIAEVWR